jgi:Rieske Fe-S protein
MTMSDEMRGRRALLAGTGAIGVALVAGCSTYGAKSSPTPTTGGATRGPAPSGSGGAPGGTDLGKAAEIPVGGGKIFADQDVVVTQPQSGTFKAFSATCTHQGCTVGSVDGGTINCPCHGSKYAVADGSVVNGPAPRALPPKTVTVANGDVFVS